jgi:hypothetical protein
MGADEVSGMDRATGRLVGRDASLAPFCGVSKTHNDNQDFTIARGSLKVGDSVGSNDSEGSNSGESR